jgi:endonuclease G
MGELLMSILICNRELIEEQEKRAADRFEKATKGGEADWESYRKSLAVSKPSELASGEKLDNRKKLLDPEDTLAYERIMGKSDLFPISYLEMGKTVSTSVCRVEIRDSIGRVQGYGTGFLVSPSLLLTNNHVLEDGDSARYSVAQFNYENDINLYPLPVKTFSLEPDLFFETDKELDFTLVAVKHHSKDGVMLTDFGYLQLIPATGKINTAEYVSIIQHPEGAPKAIAVRENQVIGGTEGYLHYVTDTQPGSSGSPVLSDDWKVVALHHAGVPDPNDSTRYIANEGIRVSAILESLTNRKAGMNSEKARYIDELFAASAVQPGERRQAGMIAAELDATWYRGMAGYDPAFLGNENAVPLPSLEPSQERDIAITDEGNRELKYTHFSIVMSKSRRLAFFTAVNIDGSQLKKVPRDKDVWFFDPRIDRSLQCGPELYEENDLDRGHLVRRLDPVWGEDAAKANEDTFHFTNCSPQHTHLNRGSWLNLEEYILKNAGKYALRLTVFTGPIFRTDDILYKGQFQIPAEFWKVVAVVNEDGSLSATAYLQTQKNLISDLEFAYGTYKTYQVPVSTIESLTRLSFGTLRTHDPLARIERSVGRLIEHSEDIRL